MAEEIQCWNSKDALAHIDQEAIVTQSLQYLSKVQPVLLMIVAGNEQVINVTVTERKATQYFIDESLKCLRSISETEWHPEEPKRRRDSRLGDVLGWYQYLMIRSDEIDIREYSSSL